MQIDPDLVGTVVDGYEAEIRWRDMTNYAAAVGDPNPIYFDDEREGGIVAHPVFPVSVTWPILVDLDKRLRSPAVTKEILATRVHYTEHLILHRPIPHGEKLTVSGSIAAVKPHRAGTHVVIRLAGTDIADAYVFTEYIGAMFRGVACKGAKGEEDLPPVPEGRDGGPPAWDAMIHMTELSPYIYDGCANIVFPIHTSPSFAHSVGLPGIIVQGTLTLACAVGEIVNREADADPRRVAEIAGRFTGMVLPGSTIRVCCTGKEVQQDSAAIFFDVFNDKNEKAVRSGYVRLR